MRVNFEGTTYNFPDDATDAEIQAFFAKMPHDNSAADMRAPGRGLAAVNADDQVKARVAQIDAEIERLKAPQRGPLGGALSFIPGMSMGAVPGNTEANRARIAELQAERDKIAVNNTGETVGGMAGGMAGAATGAVAGSVFGPIGAGVGAIIGGLIGSTGGIYAGTKYDVNKFRELAGNAEVITEQQAEQLLKDRLIENALWEGGTAILLGGGRVLRVANPRAGFKELLRQFVGAEQTKEQVIEQIRRQRTAGNAQRAAAKPGSRANEAGSTLSEADVRGQVAADPTLHPDARGIGRVRPEYTAEELSRRSGTVVTQGQQSGEAGFFERIGRNYRPDVFEDAAHRQESAVEQSRRNLVAGLDTDQLPNNPLAAGNALQEAADAAESTIKRGFAPVAQRVEASGARVGMMGPVQHVEQVLAADQAAGRMNLKPGERTALENFMRAVTDADGKPMNISVEAAMDLLSGTKAVMRDKSLVDQPSDYFRRVLGELNRLGQQALDAAVERIDPALRREFTEARRMYGEGMGALYSDTMRAIRRGNPEDAGRIIAANNNVTEVLELRRALARIADPSGALPPVAGNNETEQIFRRMLAGYLEKSFQDVKSLAELPRKMQNPEFRKVYAAMTANNPEARQMLEVAHQAARAALEKPAAHARAPFAGLFILFPGMIAKAITTADKGVLNAMLRVAAYSKNAVGSRNVPTEIAKLVDRLTEFAHSHGLVPANEQAAPEAPAEPAAPAEDQGGDPTMTPAALLANPHFQAGAARGVPVPEEKPAPTDSRADPGMRVSPAAQRGRDADALAVLQYELQDALKRGDSRSARMVREEIARWARTGRRMQLMKDAFAI